MYMKQRDEYLTARHLSVVSRLEVSWESRFYVD